MNLVNASRSVTDRLGEQRRAEGIFSGDDITQPERFAATRFCGLRLIAVPQAAENTQNDPLARL
jgi:hypothetical protein